MKSKKYIPPYKVSGRALNLIPVAETVTITDKKTNKKTNKKTDQKILSIMRSMPDVTLAELANATGLSVAGVRWNIRN